MRKYGTIAKQLVTSLLFLVTITFSMQAQNIAITDDDTYTPNSSAMLDVKSTTKGMLVPRMKMK